MFRRINLNKKQRKYLSTSSENGSLTGPSVHKMDNGNRYKLVNDIWLDTLHSGSNHSNGECCCVPDLHHQIFVQNNGTNGNRHLLHDPSLNDPSIKSKFLSDTCTQHTNSNSSNNSSQQPQYAEIYGPSIQQLQQQIHAPNTNAYATSGLFVNGIEDESNSPQNPNNPYNLINYQTMNNNSRQMSFNANNGYTLKMLSDKIQADLNMPQNSINHTAATLNDQKKLLKYLQSTQSQSNTPRVLAKNLQNRVKSENHANNFCTMHHAPTNPNPDFNNRYIPPQQSQIPHQMVTYLDTAHQDSATNEAIRNFLEQNTLIQQQQQQQPNSSSTPIPSLPVVPPPSLASALLAQQHNQLSQQQQKQLIEGYNNLLNTISRSQQQQSPVQYNSPWNGVNDGQSRPLPPPQSAFSTRLAHNPSNSSSLLSSMTGHSTLSRNQAQQQQSTFTAQQYANRQNQSNQEQQDYSSISPVDDLAEAEMEELNYKQNNRLMNMNQVQQTNNNRTTLPANPVHSWASVADTNSNPISSSYDSQVNQNNSLNSSNLSTSKRSDDDSAQGHMQGNQHYANHDLGDNERKSRFQPIQLKTSDNSNPKSYLINEDSSEVYMSEMPQTIL